MKQEKLNIILEKHEKWLKNKPNGERANLRGADLSGAYLRRADLSDTDLRCANLIGADLSDANLSGTDLSGVNLSGADLRRADLSDTDLRCANLIGADLSDANLSGTDLSGVNLSCADLRGTDLHGANLSNANLIYANLSGADLSGVNLSGAYLRRADLRRAKTEGIKYDCETSFYVLQCPEVGSFTAFKKCDNQVVELFIPKSAKRSSATSRKCRADKAKVIAIYNLDKTISDLKEISSNYDKSFIYKVGKTVIVKDFDENRWNECSTGIHFFITFDEAKQY